MNDFVNGVFEFIGGLTLWYNVLALYADKRVMGIRWPSVAFFGSWGVWNLYYYPSLNQWWSFTGGLFIVSANAVWLYLVWLYKDNH